MNPLLKILVYVGVVLICGIIFSPIAYWVCQWIIAQGYLGFLEGFPFHRYFSRTVQVSGFILLLPFVRWLHVTSFRQLGIERNMKAGPDLWSGFAIAIVPMLLLAVGSLIFGVYQLRPEPNWVVLFRIVGTAAVVAVLEEFFFRAVLLGLAVRSLGRTAGLWITTLIFAGIHFCRPSKEHTEAPVTWLSGLDQLATIGTTLPPWPILLWGLATLVLVGLILGVATLQTKSLWLAIGLHAGWVFAQQTFSLFARFRVKPPDALLPWMGPNVVSGMVPTGIVPIIAVILCAGGMAWYLRSARMPMAKLVVA